MNVFVYLSISLDNSRRSLRENTILSCWFLYSQCLAQHINNASQIYYWEQRMDCPPYVSRLMHVHILQTPPAELVPFPKQETFFHSVYFLCMYFFSPYWNALPPLSGKTPLFEVQISPPLGNPPTSLTPLMASSNNLAIYFRANSH